MQRWHCRLNKLSKHPIYELLHFDRALLQHHPFSRVRQNKDGLDNHVSAAPNLPFLLAMRPAGGSHHFDGKSNQLHCATSAAMVEA